MSLLLIIRDVMHNKKERVQSTMGLVKSNAALYTTTPNRADTPYKYYRVLKTQVDTIEAHDRNPRYHCALAREHVDAYTIKKGYDTQKDKRPSRTRS